MPVRQWLSELVLAVLLKNVRLLAKKALTRPVDEHSAIPYVKELEEEMLEKINRLGIGPGGLGGTTTALAVNMNTYRDPYCRTSGGSQYLLSCEPACGEGTCKKKHITEM